MANELKKAEEAVENAKTTLSAAKEKYAAGSPEVKEAEEAVEVAEGNLSSVRGSSSGNPQSHRKPAGKVKSKAREAKEEFMKIAEKGVTTVPQAEKVFALSNPVVPKTAEDEDPIGWAYVTYDGNIFFKKNMASKHAYKISGGVAGSDASKYVTIKLS